MIVHQHTILKLFLSLLVGIIIGLEREIKKKPLGLKTTIIIAVSSCLLTVISIEAAYTFSSDYNRPMDPLRLAAQIVSGVGFLGAGAILRRSNDVISGLTTAAMIWGAAGLGIAIGAGFYQEALIALVFMIGSIEIIAPLVKKLGPRTLRLKELKVKLTVPVNVSISDVLKILRDYDMKIKYVKIKDVVDREMRTVDLILLIKNDRYTSDVYEDIKNVQGIESVEVELI
ncbi:MgtC/SapB family protein [Metabacillus indicus]|uniref:MgtC/SapB family protein n=1 Tax=Metabacillus indicus TaxID=246786 RepID=UPI002A0044AF|nr:MgtC/SapB family protein [Metabacillus indicus]MDX8290333.1 MgtC/SapB family protein [Metabacillus indicus]